MSSDDRYDGGAKSDARGTGAFGSAPAGVDPRSDGGHRRGGARAGAWDRGPQEYGYDRGTNRGRGFPDDSGGWGDFDSSNRGRAVRDFRDRSPGRSRGRDRLGDDRCRSRSRSFSSGRDDGGRDSGIKSKNDDKEELDEFGRVIVKPKSKAALEDMTEEEQMQAMLGFGGFGSTKNKSASDKDQGAARGAIAASGTRQYRQYMNRTGGFNQSLGKVKQTKRMMK